MADLERAPRGTRTTTDGVAVIMPVHAQAESLESTVEGFLATMAQAGHDHRIVVVDDGSPDGTGQVLDELAARYPDRIVAVRHDDRQGHEAAIRTGIKAALERTSMGRLLLLGADGRLKPTDLPVLLRVQREERADAVIGFREWAGPLFRRAGGRVRPVAGRLLLGTHGRDALWDYRLLDCRLLDEREAGGASVPAEPASRSRAGDGELRIIEHPLDGPAGSARPGGASLRTIARSLPALAPAYGNLVRGGGRWRWARRLLRPEDPVLALLMAACAVLSLVAFLHHFGQGAVLLYNDSSSHLLIARRVIDSPTAGLAQLGGVWPPLPHVLALPFIWHDAVFYSGLAGSLISMVSYLVTVRYLYLIAAGMAGDGARTVSSARGRAAGVAAAGLFALNPNVLYLQSTPMTELLLFACTAAAVHHLQIWCRTGRYTQLTFASAATLLATLTRYEGWVLALAMTAVVGYVSWRRRRGRSQAEAQLIFFGVVAFSGVLGWVTWSRVIFGDWLYWHSGEYAKPSLWVSPADRNIGALDRSWLTYSQAMVHDLGHLTLAAAALGLLAYAWRRRLRIEAVAPYTLLVFMPFFVYALYAGQRPLHLPETHGDFYNVRFGLVMALAAAVFAGYLVSLVAGHLVSPRRPVRERWIQSTLAAAVVATVLAVPGTATLAEPLDWDAGWDERAVTAAVKWLRGHYDGGRVLMENYDNETVVFDSRIPLGRIVYEGAFRLWDRALKDPAGSGIRWIYLRTIPGEEDRTWRALHGGPALTRDYTLVYQDGTQQIYRRKETP
ncbi:glycosyltransferase family 2 protein [Nonomuraea zeae]|uniref:Glycosyltransferase family 2 protein n=1 Tax=Nonomuraea zeae TaxID=1642303 RepID=A0A5S4G3P0_9ACTN|nr:glycosyltransferase family 2 protein [Nonomuraea zeae]TMR27586.1 glycosyltransferase family 2 protein [Nonomuraea zeae]